MPYADINCVPFNKANPSLGRSFNADKLCFLKLFTELILLKFSADSLS